MHSGPSFAALHVYPTNVPAANRETMLKRLEKMRRCDDLWHLRGALFDTVSRYHGESVARERLATLDDSLR